MATRIGESSVDLSFPIHHFDLKEYFKTHFSEIEDHPLLKGLFKNQVDFDYEKAFATLFKMSSPRKEYHKSSDDFDFNCNPQMAWPTASPEFILFYNTCKELQNLSEAAKNNPEVKAKLLMNLGLDKLIDGFWDILNESQKAACLGYFLPGLEEMFVKYLSSISFSNLTGPLLLFARECKLSYLQIIFNRYKRLPLIHGVCENQATQLHEKKATIEFLLQNGFDINLHMDPIDRPTALFIAAEHGDIPLFDYLKVRGAIDKDGNAEKLLKCKLNPNSRAINWKLFFVFVILAAIGVGIWRWAAHSRKSDPSVAKIFNDRVKVRAKELL